MESGNVLVLCEDGFRYSSVAMLAYLCSCCNYNIDDAHHMIHEFYKRTKLDVNPRIFERIIDDQKNNNNRRRSTITLVATSDTNIIIPFNPLHSNIDDMMWQQTLVVQGGLTIRDLQHHHQITNDIISNINRGDTKEDKKTVSLNMNNGRYHHYQH